MPLEVIADEGDVARYPDRVLAALASIAEAEGADRGEWLAKAARSAGATAVEVPVEREPRYRVVEDATARAVEVYRRALKLATNAARERLQRAARGPELRERIRRMAGPK